MPRKRLTELFPFLLPLRRMQRKFCFYLRMRLDRNRYARERRQTLFGFPLYEANSLLLNTSSGFDMQYQHNKVHNLKLAVKTMEGIVIRPGETFSFWQLVRHADKVTPYKDGLVLTAGTIVPTLGGGLCQLSNLLYWLFLHSPLTVTERHPHSLEAFPSPPGNIPHGVDATVSEGWRDLKVKNNTDMSIQLSFVFDDSFLTGRILSSKLVHVDYAVEGRNLRYSRSGSKVFRETDIYQKQTDSINGHTVTETLLYHSKCELGYEPSAENTSIGEET